jgi:Cu-processing system permease protein
MATFVIARLSFAEAARRRLIWVALVLSAVFLIVYALGFNAIAPDLVRIPAVARTQAYNTLTIAGLYVVNFLVVMMTVLTSVDTVSGEIASGTIHTLLAKPVHRWEILIGKWLGFGILLTLYLLLMAGGTFTIAYLSAGYAPTHFELGLGLLWINSLLVLSISLLGGTVLSTLANGVLVFGLFGIAFIGGWIEQIGSFLNNNTAVEVGIVSSLIMPSEALWRRAAFEMQTALSGAFGFSPFNSPSVPSPAMVGYAVVYLLVAMALGLRIFARRDL